MIANAAIFLFGAAQHSGVAIGQLREPTIIPAAIVEALCGLTLIWGAVEAFQNRLRARRAVLISNLVATGGVLLGIAALAAGAGPRTASNDLYHGIMLVLVAASLAVLLMRRATIGRL